MDTHTHSQRSRLRPRLASQPELCRDCGVDRIQRRRERSVEPIPRRLDHLAALGLDRATHQRVVTRQRLAHRFGMLLPEPGRALEISEQERNRPRRQRAHVDPLRSSALRTKVNQAKRTMSPAPSGRTERHRRRSVRTAPNRQRGSVLARVCDAVLRYPKGGFSERSGRSVLRSSSRDVERSRAGLRAVRKHCARPRGLSALGEDSVAAHDRCGRGGENARTSRR